MAPQEGLGDFIEGGAEQRYAELAEAQLRAALEA
jgi:hypothetical protein